MSFIHLQIDAINLHVSYEEQTPNSCSLFHNTILNLGLTLREHQQDYVNCISLS